MKSQAVLSRLFGSTTLFHVALATVLCVNRTYAQSGDDRPDILVDRAMRTALIEKLAAQVESSYVFPDVANNIARRLRDQLRSGAYGPITSAKTLTQMLTAEMRKTGNDQHFRLDYFVIPRPMVSANTSEPTAQQQAERHLASTLHNFGFARVERLAGNVGYIKRDKFELPELASENTVAAMRFLANTDALIIDLRENGGGHAQTAALLASYFSEGQVHLSDVYSRSANFTKQNWTLAYVPGVRYTAKPVFVLTAKRTFSAAEGLAYDLQALKRATVVGEITRGGANPTGMFQLTERFAVLIPTGYARNVATGKNWDGVGVQPDVKVSASVALQTAHLAAVEAIMPIHRDDPLTAELDRAAATLRTELQAASGNTPRDGR